MKWTKEQDAKLYNLKVTVGLNFREVAEAMSSPGQTISKGSCLGRFRRIYPDIRFAPHPPRWTDEDDQIVLKRHKPNSSSTRRLAKLLGRKPVAIEERYRVVMERWRFGELKKKQAVETKRRKKSKEPKEPWQCQYPQCRHTRQGGSDLCAEHKTALYVANQPEAELIYREK